MTWCLDITLSVKGTGLRLKQREIDDMARSGQLRFLLYVAFQSTAEESLNQRRTSIFLWPIFEQDFMVANEKTLPLSDAFTARGCRSFLGR